MKRKTKQTHPRTKPLDTDKVYQRIGEFVVGFHWIEDKFRQIGWLILDPMRNEWPPMSLRNLSNKELIDKVEAMFVNLVGGLDIEDRDERIHDFRAIVAGCHKLREYRNSLLHSAYIELKGGGEVLGILRSNPKVKADAATGDMVFDEEDLTGEAIDKRLKTIAELGVPLGQHYLQLIHWSPFDSTPKRINVPIRFF